MWDTSITFRKERRSLGPSRRNPERDRGGKTKLEPDGAEADFVLGAGVNTLQSEGRQQSR